LSVVWKYLITVLFTGAEYRVWPRSDLSMHHKYLDLSQAGR